MLGIKLIVKFGSITYQTIPKNKSKDIKKNKKALKRLSSMAQPDELSRKINSRKNPLYI